MCDYEEFLWVCGHSVIKFKSYCHFKRNHSDERCNRVKMLKSVWNQEVLCENCINAGGVIVNGGVYYATQQ